MEARTKAELTWGSVLLNRYARVFPFQGQRRGVHACSQFLSVAVDGSVVVGGARGVPAPLGISYECDIPPCALCKPGRGGLIRLLPVLLV